MANAKGKQILLRGVDHELKKKLKITAAEQDMNLTEYCIKVLSESVNVKKES